MTGAPILVTGAGGFVCSELALALDRSGRHVIAVDQAFDEATTARLGQINRIEGDVQTCLTDAVGSVSAVIHGAAITAPPEALGISRAVHIRRNTDLLTSTLEFAQSAGANRFLFISSMGVFEPGDGPAPNGRFTEATVPTATCAYCAAKHAGERLTTSAAEDGIATLSLRLGNVFGPHEAVRRTRQHLCLATRMVAEARESRVITVQTPMAQREWAWLPDLADGIARLLTASPWTGPSVLHAGTPPAMSDLELAQAIADRMPGTNIRQAAVPHAAIRPPMGSEYTTELSDVDWTPIEAALDILTPARITS